MSCVFEHLGGCSGRLDPHHIVPQAKLKREFPYGFWLDTREPIRRSEWLEPNRPFRSLHELLTARSNIVPICRFHHERLENRRIYLDPPESAVRFAAELGLLHVIEKQKARAA